MSQGPMVHLTLKAVALGGGSVLMQLQFALHGTSLQPPKGVSGLTERCRGFLAII